MCVCFPSELPVNDLSPHVQPGSGLSSARTSFAMFNDVDDLAAYEDELYREESSSEESIDSEVETYLYSQVHYSQDLSKGDILDDQEKEDDVVEKVGNLKTSSHEKKSVIVISDSDDIRATDSSAVVILSDSLEEDIVYRSKTKYNVTSAIRQPENRSTPKASPKKKKKLSKLKGAKSPDTGKSYKGGIVQEVLVIRGSSEEEDAAVSEVCLTSDSDVENWMLLGRAREEGDTSIQLNLRGYRSAPWEGDDGVDWSVIERDSAAQVSNFTPQRRFSNRYYTGDKNVICRNCNYRGHLSKNCPQPKKLPACCLCGRRGHLQYHCPLPYCSNCFMPGHLHQECTERPYWQKKCHRCAMVGHYADACPEIWRQYHLTVVRGPVKKSNSASTPKEIIYCCNCGRKGHCGYECNQRRMYSTVYPNCELVFTYDQKHDIWKRDQRAKRRLKELQEAGLVLEAGEPCIEDTVHNTQLPNKMSKKSKRKNKRQKKADNRLGMQFKKKKRKSFLQHLDAEEYFIRGDSEKPKKVRIAHERKKPTHLLFKDFSNNEGVDGELKKGKKKCKKRKNCAVDESLLIIKQRKKKSKPVK
ncbi:zinc finger CCHC domain-containing protein 7-like [Bufo gargarizans]|uniref:zinc finger CCHC domain-containing protein 7-like n=1 Tax=Bufo gargarizans TaxID=30331 RepID=UPI001CF5D8C3|nr:zinc finger CCHC domain-containing protein 7-like [Bufo gargarizans]